MNHLEWRGRTPTAYVLLSLFTCGLKTTPPSSLSLEPAARSVTPPTATSAAHARSSGEEQQLEAAAVYLAVSATWKCGIVVTACMARVNCHPALDIQTSGLVQAIIPNFVLPNHCLHFCLH